MSAAIRPTMSTTHRYVDGHDDLLDTLGGTLYEEQIDELVLARDALGPEDLIPRLIAMAHAFRNWALAHRHEYGLLFASQLMTEQHTNSSCTHAAGMRFGARFAEIFAAMWEAGLITRPTSTRSTRACCGCWTTTTRGKLISHSRWLSLRPAVVPALRDGHPGGVRPSALGPR